MKLSPFLNVLYPPHCAGCRVRGAILCAACLPQATERVRIERDGISVVAVAPYAGAFRRAILSLKRGRRDAIEPLAGLLARALFDERISRDTIVVPVPTTPEHVLVRGFDQGIALARELAANHERAALVGLRKRARAGQRGRSRAERLRAADRYVTVAPGLVARANVVLVDDVVTTGATLADCAATLTASGARVCGAFVLAYA